MENEQSLPTTHLYKGMGKGDAPAHVVFFKDVFEPSQRGFISDR